MSERAPKPRPRRRNFAKSASVDNLDVDDSPVPKPRPRPSKSEEDLDRLGQEEQGSAPSPSDNNALDKPIAPPRRKSANRPPPARKPPPSRPPPPKREASDNDIPEEKEEPVVPIPKPRSRQASVDRDEDMQVSPPKPKPRPSARNRRRGFKTAATIEEEGTQKDSEGKEEENSDDDEPPEPRRMRPSISLSIHEAISSSSDEDEEDTKESRITKRLKVVREIYTTEETYVQGLKVLQEVFYEHLVNGGIPKTVLSTIFSNSKELLKTHTGFMQQLEERLDEWTEDHGIGDVFSRLAPFLKMYTTYSTNFDNAGATLKEQTEKNPQFAALLAECAKSEECRNLNLGAFLLEPVQRIPRFKLLLQEYIRRTDENHPDYPAAEDALAKISKAAVHINESIRHRENAQKMLALQGQMPGVNIMKPGRQFLNQQVLQKMCRKGLQDRTVFLFSDTLIYAREDRSTLNGSVQYESIKVFPLSEVMVSAYTSPEAPHGISILSSSQKSFILATETSTSQLKWLNLLESAIEKHTGIAGGNKATTENDEPLRFGERAPVWIPDSGVTMCMNCTSAFNKLIRRRHHCRGCGKVLCGACSAQTVPLAYLGGREERVCPDCFDTAQAQGLASLTTGGRGLSRKLSKKERAFKRSQSKRDNKPESLLEEMNSENIVMSGFLEKREDSTFNKKWKRRWYVLKDTFCLFAYTASQDVVAESSLPLPGHQVAPLEKGEASNVEFGFKVQHPGSKQKFLFSCDTAELRDKWCAAIDAATQMQFPIFDEDA